mgnify:FL=1
MSWGLGDCVPIINVNVNVNFSSVRVKQCVRSTRQSGTLLESSYRPNLITVGYRSFEAYAPSLWNALPKVLRCIDNIGTFKKTPKNTSTSI